MKTNPNTIALFISLLIFSSIDLSSCASKKAAEFHAAFLETKSKAKNVLKAEAKQSPNAATPTTTPAATTTPSSSAPISPYSNINTINPTDPNYQYYFKTNIACSNTNCMIPNGVCVDNSTCKCLDGWAVFQDANSPQTMYPQACNYQQKRQLVAFLLEFFFPCGIGHFYAGRVLMGVMKLILLALPILALCLGFCGIIASPHGEGKSDASGACVLIMAIFIYGSYCALGIWGFVDIILFGINSYKDGNGVPLLHW